jgi:glycosyltransferase involved in cell wall biosynthesis
MTSISVIVPAYNAEAILGHCLRALQAQTMPPAEIIVVDDGSSDATAEIASGLGVRVIRQANAGPAAARNAGARAARGDVLLFTDADCAPAPDWVQRMAAPFADPTVAGAKGVYLTAQSEPVARFVQLEYQDKYDRMRGQERIDFIDTYSAAYRRDVFLESGGFDAAFPTASVEDQEFSFRLARAGHRLVFAPDACVAHLHDRTLGEYARRKFWIGYWKAQVTRRYPDKLIRDSHTPQVLKAQIGLAAAGGVSLALSILTGRVRFVRWAARLWAIFGLTTFPFVHKAWRQDRTAALLAPGLLFVRAWALGMGFLLGNLRRRALRQA